MAHQVMDLKLFTHVMDELAGLGRSLGSSGDGKSSATRPPPA
jgi:hypothetical protein